MSTTGTGILNVVGYLLMIAAMVALARSRGIRYPRALRHPNPTMVTVWLVVALPSVIGLLWSAFYHALNRDPSKINHGQIWRLLTSATVQDGGIAGTIFNLVVLAVTLAVAVTALGTIRTVGLLIVGAISADAVATYLLQDPGAGNSSPPSSSPLP